MKARFSYAIAVLAICFAATSASAADCWSEIDPAFSNGVALVNAEGKKVSFQDAVSEKGELSPEMKAVKALVGIDHSSRHLQRCWSMMSESISLLNDYAESRGLNDERRYADHSLKPWMNTPRYYLGELYKLIQRFHINRQYGELLFHFQRKVPSDLHETFEDLVRVITGYGGNRLSIECKALLKSNFLRWNWNYEWEDAASDLSGNFCRFEENGLHFLSDFSEYVESISGIGVNDHPHSQHTHSQHTIIVNPLISGYLPVRVRSEKKGSVSIPKYLYDEPLWQYSSLWNWLAWQKVVAKRDPVIEKLSEYYRAHLDLDDGEAYALAHAVIKFMLTVDYSLPIPDRDIRVLILEGAPLEQVAASYPTRVINGFDDPAYRSLNEKYIWEPPECKGEWGNHKRACLFGLYYDAKYSWDYHRALVGVPEPPLLIAVLRPEVVSWLLDAGEDIEQVNQSGKTALMTAAHMNSRDTIQLLLERGADVNRRTYGHSEELETWYEPDFYGDDVPRSLQHAGRTALMYAAENANADIIDLLLSAGADPCLVDSKGLSPRSYFLGPSPSGDVNTRVVDSAERERLAKALDCPVDRHVLPPPFVIPEEPR